MGIIGGMDIGCISIGCMAGAIIGMAIIGAGAQGLGAAITAAGAQFGSLTNGATFVGTPWITRSFVTLTSGGTGTALTE